MNAWIDFVGDGVVASQGEISTGPYVTLRVHDDSGGYVDLAPRGNGLDSLRTLAKVALTAVVELEMRIAEYEARTKTAPKPNGAVAADPEITAPVGPF